MEQQLHTSSDQQLINGLRQGDEASFEAIFREFYPALCSYAHRYVGRMETAEEIVQSLFLKLWEKREALDIKRSVKAYLFNATRNNCLTHLRHEKIKANYQQQRLLSHAEKAPTFDDVLQEAELSQLIHQTIQKLPEQCRKIFQMSRVEGLKYREIAEQLQLSPKTVEAQMGKALKRIRRALSAYLIIILLFMIKLF